MAKEMIISKELQEASERLALVIGVNPLVPVLTKANAVIAVREWLKLPEVYEKIIQLKDTNSGFKTDEKPGSTPYDQRTITNCVTDALLAGFNLVGNEFNIIKGNMMGVLNGYSRLVREFENDKIKVISVELVEGDMVANGTIVKIPITINLTILDKATNAHKKESKSYTIPILSGSGAPDAWLGKATRRAFKKCYTFLSGVDFGDDMGDSVGSISQVQYAEIAPPDTKMALSDKKTQAQDAAWAPPVNEVVFPTQKTEPAKVETAQPPPVVETKVVAPLRSQSVKPTVTTVKPAAVVKPATAPKQPEPQEEYPPEPPDMDESDVF